MKTCSQYQPRRDCVDAHSLRTVFAGERASERDHGAFRCRVDEGARMASFSASKRRHVHDTCSAMRMRGIFQMRSCGAGDPAQTLEIELHDLAPESIIGLV